MSTEIMKWGDDAMYESQPMNIQGDRIVPRVFMLSGTPDPLGNLAADMRMYRGDPVYSLNEVTDEERTWAWDELSKTRLNTPLEGVQVKFMLEAVTRSFTHQMVRQRVGAYYVQESLRFAVKRGLAKETALPPSIVPGSVSSEGALRIWDTAIEMAQEAYNRLVDSGIPAEDARGLLPHAITTRIIYTTNLRALFEVAGSRLCTQAQFEWRAVFMEMMKAMSDHSNMIADAGPIMVIDAWQWKLIATPMPTTFTPICYKLGKCQFMSELDRGCTIRDRVQRFAERGVPSTRWSGENDRDRIDVAEWMANPRAGVTDDEHNRRPE